MRLKVSKKKVLFFSKHGKISNRDESTTKYFYTDGTYRCEHWIDQSRFNKWKIKDGFALWVDPIVETKPYSWRRFTTCNPIELAAELEMELAMFKLLK